MDAGTLDRRITIQRSTASLDAFNDPVKTWTTLRAVWASKADVSDRERFSSQELAAEVTTRFRIRWSAGVKEIDPQHRILFDGRVYNIVAVKEIGRREGIEITATARAERA